MRSIAASLQMALFLFLPFAFNSVEAVENSKRVYPNPFKEGTTFQLTMPREAKIRIDVYNIRGQHIRNLYGGATGENHKPGEHDVDWDGKDKFGQPVSPGVYICVLISENIIVKSVKVVKIDA